MYDGIKQAYWIVIRIEAYREMQRKLSNHRAQLTVADVVLAFENPEDSGPLSMFLSSEIERLEKRLKEVLTRD